MKQFNKLCGDHRILVEGVPHVVFRKPGPGLTQVFRQRPHHGDVPPGKTRGQHQAVVTVIFGTLGPDRHEQAFQALLHLVGKLERLAAAALQGHLVEIEKGRIRRRDPVGALVDDTESHVFQKRNTG